MDERKEGSWNVEENSAWNTRIDDTDARSNTNALTRPPFQPIESERVRVRQRECGRVSKKKRKGVSACLYVYVGVE